MQWTILAQITITHCQVMSPPLTDNWKVQSRWKCIQSGRNCPVSAPLSCWYSGY